MKRLTLRVILAAVVIAFLVVEIFPIYWIVLNSFKGFKDITFYPPKFVFLPVLDNYLRALQKNDFLSSIVDSAVISILSTVISVLIGTMAAYGIVRLHIGGNTLLLFVVSSRMMPKVLLLIPLYIGFAALGILDTRLGLILVYSTLLLSFTIWQMASFLKEIPSDVEDSATIDGCTLWQVFFRIVLPMSKPGLTAVAIFAFLFAWNDFIFGSILAGSDVITAPVAATHFVTDREIPWGPLSAACTMTMIPVFIFILVVQKQMIRGLTLGAVKE